MIESRNVKLLDLAITGTVIVLLLMIGFHVASKVMSSVEVSRLNTLAMMMKSVTVLSKSNCIVESHLAGCGVKSGLVMVNGQKVVLLNGYPAARSESEASVGIVPSLREVYSDPFHWWFEDGKVFFRLNDRQECFVGYEASLGSPRIFIVSRGC